MIQTQLRSQLASSELQSKVLLDGDRAFEPMIHASVKISSAEYSQRGRCAPATGGLSFSVLKEDVDWHVMASTRDPCSSFTFPKLHGAIPQVLQIFEDKSYSKGWLVLATKILL